MPATETVTARRAITVGSRPHAELTEVTPIPRELEAEIDAWLKAGAPVATARPVRASRPLAAAFARMTALSDRTMREIRDLADRTAREREAEHERVCRRIERVAEAAFVTLLAIGFLIWAL
jgi:hypothetical protein